MKHSRKSSFSVRWVPGDECYLAWAMVVVSLVEEDAVGHCRLECPGRGLDKRSNRLATILEYHVALVPRVASS
jgi:hypothetical protein